MPFFLSPCPVVPSKIPGTEQTLGAAGLEKGSVMSRPGTTRQNRFVVLTIGVYSWSLHRVSPTRLEAWARASLGGSFRKKRTQEQR